MLGDHGNGPKGIMGKLKKVKDTVSQHLQENSVTLQQTRTVSPEPERYRLETSSTMPTPSVPLLARPEVAKLDEQVMPQSSIAIEPEIVTRPFVKVKVVTWNMAESLPTGDLTELLGHVPRPDAANNLPRSPLNPELPELTLNDDHLYHIIVVGAQESPWLPSTINDLRAGGRRSSRVNKTWTEVLTEWFCRGGGNRFQHPDTPAPDITGPTVSKRASQSSKDPEKEMLKQQEHPVQTLEVETTPVEQALKDENHNPLDDLPDSPSKCKPSSKPPTISLSPEAAVPSLKSSSSSNTLSSTHQPDAAGVPSSEISSSADASEQTSSCHEEASADVGPYVFVAKERLLGITCCVFVLKSAHHLLQDVGKGRVTAGLLGGRMGNKGAAAISVHFAGLRFLFLSAHLAAHQNNVSARKQNITKIKEELEIDHFETRITEENERERLNELTDVTQRFDVCFWFGDLNFRVQISRLHADFLIQSKKFEHMLAFDQLNSLLKERNSCLKGFKEAPINFAPTYKYDVISRKKLHRRSTQSNSERGSFKQRPMSLRSVTATADKDRGSLVVASEASPSAPSDFDNSDAASISSATTAGFDSSGEMRPGTPSALSSPADIDESSHVPVSMQKARFKLLGIMRSKSITGGLSLAQQLIDDTSSPSSSRPVTPILATSPRPELRYTKSEYPVSGVDLEQQDQPIDHVAIFDTSKKQRVQSYTDRILFVSRLSKPKDADRSIARKLGAGIVDGFKLATRTLQSTPLASSDSHEPPQRIRPSPSHRSSGSLMGSRQVSFDVLDSAPTSPQFETSDAITPTTAVPSGMRRNASVRSQASSQASGTRRLGRFLHRRRQGSGRSRSLSLPGIGLRSENDLAAVRTEHPHSAVTPSMSMPFSESPMASQPNLPQPPESFSKVTSAQDAETPRTATPQVQFPRRAALGRDPLRQLTLSRTITQETSIDLSPQRHRHNKSSGPGWSLRHWLNNHVPLWSQFAGSMDDLGLMAAASSDSAVPTPEPQIQLLGPQPGEIECLVYNTANDLHKMEAVTDHRPLFGVYAVGLAPVT